MALHDDLLAQAERLARIDRRRPKQANLRRAVSSAYYALFHFLVDQSSRFLVSGPQREGLRHQLARGFDHGHMKKAAQAFAAPNAGQNPWRAVLGAAPSAALVEVALAFSALQEARHEADYDLARLFTRGEVEAFVARARDAFAHWGDVAGTAEGEAFLVALLVRGRP